MGWFTTGAVTSQAAAELGDRVVLAFEPGHPAAR
jgi:hypothetical protein